MKVALLQRFAADVGGQRRDWETSRPTAHFFGLRLIKSQKATAVANATPDRKFAASLS
jgi:hypothetical protein